VSAAARARPAPRTIPNLRWWIVGLLFLSTVINYVDRQTLSILARTIQNDLGMDDAGYADVVQAFLLAYTVAYLLAGRITDWLGTRLSMAAFVAWWSVANVLTAFAASAFSLGAFRFLLGLGEPGNYTAAPKAVTEWFAPRERALAVGVYTAGATIGATIAPPLIAFLAFRYGWRGAFVVTGLAGLLWLVPWLWLYRAPREHPRVRPEELARLEPADLQADLQPDPAAAAAPRGAPRRGATRQAVAWGPLLRRRETWLLTLARLVTDPVWYFYLFWFPKYLTDARGLPLARMAALAWLVYLAADAGSIVGGWTSGALVRRGLAPVAARKRVMAGAALLLPLSLGVPFAPTLSAALAFACVAGFAHLAWQVTLSTLITDLYPQRAVATVFGVIAAGSGLGGLLSTRLVGYLVTEHSYTPVFVGMGLLHPAALALVWRVRHAGPAPRPGAPAPAAARAT
jgi:ACS family hexuronate transporter-like MFS transporter